MIEKRFGTLKGLEAPILVYETAAEANAIADKKDAAGNLIDVVLQECNNNLAYRGCLDDARDTVCALLEEKTGIARRLKDSTGALEGTPEFGLKGKKDKEEKLITSLEAQGSFAEYICVTKGWEDLKFLQSEFDERCRNMPETDDDGNPKKDEQGNPIVFALAVDITQRVRTSKPKVLAAKYIDTAKKVLAGKVDKFIAAVKAEVGQDVVLSGDPEKDIKTIGWAAKALCDVRERAALAAMPGVEA